MCHYIIESLKSRKFELKLDPNQDEKYTCTSLSFYGKIWLYIIKKVGLLDVE